MKRRAFLGFLGGAAVAGPQAAASAAQAAQAEFQGLQTGMGMQGWSAAGAQCIEPASSFEDWPKLKLARLLGMSKEAVDRERREMQLSGLDPDVACLHSVSLGRKIEMSRWRQYDRSRRRERSYLQGVIDGLWD